VVVVVNILQGVVIVSNMMPFVMKNERYVVGDGRKEKDHRITTF